MLDFMREQTTAHEPTSPVDLADQARKLPVFLTSMEARVLRALGTTPRVVDVIADAVGVSSATARSMSKRLVERGLASVHADGRYAVVKAGVAVPRVEAKRTGDVRSTVRGCNLSILVGDAEDRLRGLEAGSVDVGVTSSPYFHEREYWSRGQTGWEPNPKAFATRLIDIFAQVARVISPHGLFFWNFDDYVHNNKKANIDSMVDVALERIGLEKTRKIIWHKTNPVPSGTDRSLAHAYEEIHVLKRANGRHYWDAFASRQDAKGGGMKRLDDVWEMPVANHSHPGIGSHNAVFPLELVRRCLSVSTSEKGCCPVCRAPWRRILERGDSTWKIVGASHRRSKNEATRRGKADYIGAFDANGRDVTKKMADMKHVGWEPSCEHDEPPTRTRVLDPFMGSGTTGLVAVERGFDFLGIDVSDENVASAAEMIAAKASDVSHA